jgi:hypothetical protein
MVLMLALSLENIFSCLLSCITIFFLLNTVMYGIISFEVNSFLICGVMTIYWELD